MKRKSKKIITFISIFLAFIILSVAVFVYFSFFHRYKGTTVLDEWNESDSFSADNIVTLEKTKGEDFVILNLADIQLCDTENFFDFDVIKSEIDFLIGEAKPDLITLTGDQTWSNENLLSLKRLIKLLDSYKIPYAPIFGNHDLGNSYNSAVASANYCSDLYEASEYCLFKRGPSNLGSLGNYIINVTEDGKIVKTLYMLDASYGDTLTDSQISWVKWNADGIKALNGNNYSSAICFMHKPIGEFASAYYSYLGGSAESSVKVLVNSSLSGIYENGFFDVAKNIGISHFVSGHQHTNSFSIDFDGTRFTFALKTGELGFYYDDGLTNFNGATVIKITDDSTETVENIYTESGKFHIDGSRNTFLE